MYVGAFNKGKPTGYGKYILTDGSYIIGDFKEGILVKGSLYSSSGNLIKSRNQSNTKDIFTSLLKITNAIVTGMNNSNKNNKSVNSLNFDLYQERTGNNFNKPDFSSASEGCDSDFYCMPGYSCVKKPFTVKGVCLKSVDDTGTATYNSPSLDSIGVQESGSCQITSDCPPSFRCDRDLKACVK